jgi:hypothetical protein
MSTTYTSTVEVNVWKEHTCAQCGTVYRYLFKRTKQGQGATPDAAAQAAHNAVVDALAKEVDLQPCTGCGAYQPDMIAAQRSSRHWWGFWIGLVPFLTIFILVLSDVLAKSTAAYALAGTLAVLAFWHLLADAFSPNANLDANRRLALDREQRGELWSPSGHKADSAGKPIGSGINTGHTIGYVLLAIALALFLAAPVYALATGARINPAWNSEVLGPGEEGYVYFADSITSVKGYWSAHSSKMYYNQHGQLIPETDALGKHLPNPEVIVSNAAELGLAQGAVTARGKQDNWGGGITIGRKESTTSSPRLYAYVRLPRDPSLAGKTLQLRIDMRVHYPHYDGNNKYHDTLKDFTHTTQVTLSQPGAGSTYVSLWWLGLGVGTLLACTGAIVLAVASSAFRAQALPTGIFVPDEPGLADDTASPKVDANEPRPPVVEEREEGRYSPKTGSGESKPRREDDY